MILNKEDEFLNSPPGRSQALGVTLGQAASPRPGMQPAWAAPCPNQFEPAVGMEPWRVPTSSLWRPRRAQSGCCGLLLGSPPRGQAAGSLPAGGRGARGRLAPKTPPGAAVAPGWAPRPHSLPPPHPLSHLASPPATKWLPVCVFSRSPLPAQASGTQGSRCASFPSSAAPWKLPENTDAETTPQ